MIPKLSLSHIPNNLRTWGLRIFHKLRLSTLRMLLVLVGALSSLFRTRTALQLENLALRHQIGVLQRSVKKRPRLTAADRILWAWLCGVWSEWRSALVIVKPETVIAWHRKGFRLFWTWKIRHGQVGRPAVPKEVRCPWARMRQNRDRRDRRRRGESWQFRSSAGSTIATNAGPPENDSRGCSHFAGRSVSRESLPGGQHREDGVRTTDHCLALARHQHLLGHSIGSRRPHVPPAGFAIGTGAGSCFCFTLYRLLRAPK
jgi:hypothetical protein